MDQPRNHEPGGCPAFEEIAAYLDGQVSRDERAALQAHFADCERCRELLAEASQTLDALSGTPAATAGARRRAMWRWLVPVSVAAAVALLAVRLYSPTSGTSPEIQSLVDAAGPFRAGVGRLTGGFEYAAPTSVVRSGENARELPPELRLAIARAEERSAKERSSTRLHALGVAMLLEGRHDAAVAALEDAVSGAPQDAAALSDLAAAYLARARAANRADDLTRGLAAADRSIAAARAQGQKAPIEALFNRALLLESQAQHARARDAWTEYLTQDGQSGWAAEARDHLQRLSSR